MSSIFEYLPDWLKPPESLGADQQVSAEEPAMVPQSDPDPQAQQEAVNYYAAKDAEQQAQQQASEPSTGSYEIPQELPVGPPKSFPSPKEWLAMKNERQKVTPIPDVMIPQQQPNMTPAQKETMDNALASMGKSPVYDVMSAIGVAPAVETGLDALSYLDKPRGAIAGAIKAGVEGGDVLQGAGEGWDKNTSYGDVVIPEKVQKDHPYLTLAGSMAMDTLLDPMWLLPPAKLASLVGKAGRATKAGVAMGKAVDAASDTKFGKWAEAVKQDMLGESRIEDLQDAYTRGRSFDSVQADDVRDAVKSVEKEHGKYAGDKVAEYVEAAERPNYVPELTDQARTDILDAHNNGTLANLIKDGAVSKEHAFETLRDSGEAVPSYLLQQHQIDAKLAGEAIPDYVYRDAILEGVGNEHLRNAIQTVGDKFIEMNKANTSKLEALGKLDDEALAHFPDGSHLRRSNEKYTDPEKYLKELEKNGTPDEYAKAYEDIYGKRVSSGIGDSAHKVPVKDFTQRQELSTDTLNKLGVIGNTEYRMADTLNRGSKSIRESEFLKDVAEKWGVDGQEAGKLSMNLPDRRKYVKIQEAEAFGDLAGKWVPKDVAEQVNRALGNRNPGEIGKAWEKAVSWWKVSKLAAPSPMFRNFYSGLPMANVYGEVPLHQIPKYMGQVMNEYARNGKKNAQLIREMREQGLFGNNWQKAEMNNILNGTEWGQFKESGKKLLHGDVTEAPSAAVNLFKAGANKSMEAFGAPDQFWRAVVYAYHRDHGKTAEQAAKMADRSMFDYNKAPEFINQISRNGVIPFAKFPYFAARETARALWNKPASVSTWTRPSYQDDQRQDKLAVLPDYLKGKTMMPLGKGTRMVNGKPVPVENNLDVSYVMPFLNDVSLGNPALEMLQIARTGKNSLGMDVIKDGMTDDEKRDAYLKQLGGAIGPSAPLPIPGNYAWDTLVNGWYGKTDAKGRQYDWDSALAQSVFGLRNMPISYEDQTANSLFRKEMELKNNKAMVSKIKKDKSLSDEEREAKIADHKRQENQLKWEKSVILDAGRRLGYRGK